MTQAQKTTARSCSSCLGSWVCAGSTISLIQPTVGLLSTSNKSSIKCLIIATLSNRRIPLQCSIIAALNLVSGKYSIPWITLQSQLFGDPNRSDNDTLVILDCCYSGLATRSGASCAHQVLAACLPHEISKRRAPNSVSFTQRIWRAACHFFYQKTLSTAQLYQQLMEDLPKAAPEPILKTFGGNRPITFVFTPKVKGKPGGLPTILVRLPTQTREKNVLAKLTLSGDTKVFPVMFQAAIRTLPPDMKVDIMDCFETDDSVFFILRMTFECLALWEMVVNLDKIGSIIGPSLMTKPKPHQPQQPLDP
ncbi:hypothetical protein N7495_004179 [Penicillium taxi]|uniref:uncharacterized protein n=1 Tax=Penicillium taxi TaxID=168475 RepID=UPI0025452F5D|nr:uncharacterized protein N7495_004179 [Penicillium taxi]KAJ5899435.1 hypothetical protein N7495_004179 [Penicillium taxi]